MKAMYLPMIALVAVTLATPSVAAETSAPRAKAVAKLQKYASAEQRPGPVWLRTFPLVLGVAY